MTSDSNDQAGASKDDQGVEGGVPSLGSIFSALGLPNPVAPVVQTVEQVRRGCDSLMLIITTLQSTLEQLNGTAARINRLLDEVEDPMKSLGDTLRQLGPLAQLAGMASGFMSPPPAKADPATTPDSTP